MAQNMDYSVMIKDAIGRGASDAVIQDYLGQRQNKITSQGLSGKVESNEELLKNLGYTPKPQQTAAQAPTAATDNSGLINSQYGNLVSALKNQIQQGINNKNQQVAGLPQQYQPQKDESEVRKADELRTALEQSANAGDRGGIGRQNALNTQIAGENRLKDINLQQESAKNSLLNDIANLNLEGNVQEANLNAQKIKDLIANNQYVDTTNYNRSQDALQNALAEAGLTGYYKNNPTLAKQQMDTQNSQWQQQFDYGKQRDTVADQQWQKQFDEGIRQFDKQFDENQRQWNQQFAFNQRQQSFNERQAQVENAIRQGQLSIQQGELQLSRDRYAAENDPKSLDNQYKQAQIDALKNKSTNYENSPDFQADYSGIFQTRDGTYQQVVGMSTELIQKYGVDGYNKLLAAAKQADPLAKYYGQ